jgi:hypothetical protein
MAPPLDYPRQRDTGERSADHEEETRSASPWRGLGTGRRRSRSGRRLVVAIHIE